MPEATRIAQQMLACELPSSDIAEVVFKTAGKFYYPTRMVTPASAAFVKKSAKQDGWQAAVTHAESTVDASLLAVLAKDSRKQVRRAVAANKHSDQATLQYLFDWAIKADDEETMNLVAHRVDVMWALQSPRLYSIGRALKPWKKLATRVFEAGDEAIAFAISQQHYPLDMAMADRFALGACSLMSLRDFVARYENHHSSNKASLIRRALECGSLDVELAELLVETGDFGAGVSRYGYDGQTVKRATCDEALQVLIDSKHAWTWVLASSVVTNSAQIDELLAKRCDSVFTSLWERVAYEPDETSSTSKLPVTSEQLYGVVRGVVGVGSYFNATDVFTNCDPEVLTPKVVMFTLKNSDARCILQWMAGKFSVKPLPGQVREILSSAGHLLATVHYSPYASKAKDGELDMAAVARTCRSVFDEAVRTNGELPVWLEELIDVLGVHFFEVVSYSAAATQILVKRFRAYIGDDPQAWMLAMSLLSNQGGSLTELCESVRLIVQSQGIEVPATVELVAKPKAPERTVQLSFLD